MPMVDKVDPLSAIRRAAMAAVVLVVLYGWVPAKVFSCLDGSVPLAGKEEPPLAVAWVVVAKAPMARSFSGMF